MKKRIDSLVFEQGLARSRSAAAALIKARRIKVGSEIVAKNSELFEENEKVELLGDEVQYVGRGGLKLEQALTDFKIETKDLAVLDVGSSTGGFTECVLRHRARKVYAVDVGTDQLAKSLKDDPRVVSMEQTDIRGIDQLPEKIDLAVIDVSFISLELVLEKVKSLIKKDGQIIALVKPQFETDKSDKNKSGIVKTEELQKNALNKIKKFCEKVDLKILGEVDSPILGGSGNKEYFLYLQK